MIEPKVQRTLAMLGIEEEQKSQEEVPIEILVAWVEEELNMAWNHSQMLADRLNRGRGGRECSLCITKIEEALHRVRDVKHQLEIEAL